LLQSNHMEESVSMAYYSMYYLLTSLLFRTGIKCENHAASIILLTELFGIDNAKISFAKRERIDKQYYVDFQITKEEAQDIIKIAEEISAELTDFISRPNTEQIISKNNLCVHLTTNSGLRNFLTSPGFHIHAIFPSRSVAILPELAR